ncbi:MAG TPA: heavy metal translocating P-type ATPase [Terracidiphilus sp.]|nr:heavy metal translocating P-type ATPase [Terracidiphilus sp.]
MAASTKESLTLPVLGMSCAACQHHVEAALRSTAGVQSARVDLMAHRARVVFDPGVAPPQKLIEAIRSAGYDAVLPRTDQPDSESEADHAAAGIAAKATVTIIAGALAMLVAMPLGAHAGPVDEFLMRTLPALYAVPAYMLRWSLLILTTILLIWAARGIYFSAIRGIFHAVTNMNTLVTLGTGVAYTYSAYATLDPAPGRQVYFDAVLLILGFLLLGKALEIRAKRRALAAIDSLSRLRPSTARLVRDGQQTTVPLEQIQPGDTVLVLPGERFPVDANIVEGQTTVDESMLTGESTPLAREVGGRVLAGSLNYDGAVVCSATSLGEDTLLSQITRMVQQAQSSRAPMERLADRTSAIFVPCVIAVAAVTFLIWMLTTHSLQMSVASAVSVLVIACPCAMGLAVPAALTVAVGRGAQLGVLFKGGEALERLTHLDVVVLDKTGTLTVGHPVLAAIHALSGFEEDDLLRFAAAAEERSNHPLAHAVVDEARQRKITWQPAEDVRILPGRGLTARVEDYNLVMGNDALFREHFGKISDRVPPAKPGFTRLWIALDNQCIGAFDARDALRPDASEAVLALRRSGLRVLMLTGDSETAAAPIANQAGIHEVEAGLDPAAKLARIRALQEEGLRVAMVGDGVNDAGALAQADAGLAMGTGSDLAQEAGDVLLLRAQPSAIPAALDLAHSTLRVMQQNLTWAAGYNLLGIPIAAGMLYPTFHILLSPWVAAAAMALSSVSVLSNSLRLRRWRPRLSPSPK